MYETQADLAISAINSAQIGFCKFLSANDTGETGGHQAGIYIPKEVSRQITGVDITKGKNDKFTMQIAWPDCIHTNSVMTYYGTGTRNETRITCFGRGFPFLAPENTGDLFILVRLSEFEYSAFLLTTDDDIERFLLYFNLSPIDTNAIISTSIEQQLKNAICEAIKSYTDFPPSNKMSELTWQLAFLRKAVNQSIIMNEPDEVILKWIDIEFALFRELEQKIYQPVFSAGFSTVDSFIELANKVLNRRKSRAGKSLEHHLAQIFYSFKLSFTAQAITEGNKKPDFIFPGEENYHNPAFASDKLVFLGAKTTCKDRWRQVLNEANRIPHKHLFTLQQGISSNQLKEMQEEKVSLVVPKQYIKTFPESFRKNILTLNQFITLVQEKAA